MNEEHQVKPEENQLLTDEYKLFQVVLRMQVNDLQLATTQNYFFTVICLCNNLIIRYKIISIDCNSSLCKKITTDSKIMTLLIT